MTAAHWAGPVVVFGEAPFGDNNGDRGPSLFYAGGGLLDPRQPFTYAPGSARAPRGFLGFTNIPVVSAAPAAATAAALAAAQAGTANTPLNLVTASGPGVTVGVSTTNVATGQAVTGLCALDYNPAVPEVIPFGQGSALWNPAALLARNVTLTSTGNNATVVFTVKGYDVYGYPMVETITGVNANTVAGKKAFKFVASVTPSANTAANVSVGIGTVFGFPMLVPQRGNFSVVWNNVVGGGTFAPADVTNPATATTGDVRGTLDVTGGGGTAPNGTILLQIFVTPDPSQLVSVEGLFGVAQYAG
jgi:hypothetical protein